MAALAATSLYLTQQTRSLQGPAWAKEEPPWRRKVASQSSVGPKAEKKSASNVLRVEFEPGKGSLLGEGTFGTVVKAREATTDKAVALKIVGVGAKSLAHEIGALKKVSFLLMIVIGE